MADCFLRRRAFLGGALVATGAGALLAATVFTRRFMQRSARALSTQAVAQNGLSENKRFELAERLWPRILNYLDSQADTSIPCVKHRNPDELRAVFAETGVPLPFGSSEPANDVDSLLRACDAVMEYSVRAGSPLFNNQLYGTADPAGMAGDILAAVMNTNAHTYEVAPVFTLMEYHVLAKLAQTVGGAYAEKHDGLFLPGGSLSNTYALQLARFSYDNRVKEEGNAAVPGLVAFTSEHAHYSYLKGSNLLGIGTKNLIKVRGDPVTGDMDPQALKEAIQKALDEGKKPFFVGATAGTTVLGSFDPFNQVMDVVEEFNQGKQSGEGRIWVHVDGAWGGATLFSARHKHRMDGVERVDSYSWNPHKLMGAPLQCSLFLTRHEGQLIRANGAQASYLFQPDKENTQYDVGDKTVTCGRKIDALKMWIQWKTLGDAGLTRRVDSLIHLAEYMAKQLDSYRDEQGRRCFAVVTPTSFTNVCFYLIPPSKRNNSDDPMKTISPKDLSTVAPKVKARMQEAGKALIGFQPVSQYPNCWRMVFAGAKEDTMSEATVDSILDSMVELSKDL